MIRSLLYLMNVNYLANGGMMNPNEIRQAYTHRIRRALGAIAPIRGEIFTAVTDGDQSLYEARRALRNCIALLDTADDEAFLHAESVAARMEE